MRGRELITVRETGSVSNAGRLGPGPKRLGAAVELAGDLRAPVPRACLDQRDRPASIGRRLFAFVSPRNRFLPMKHHCQQFAKTPMTRRPMLSQVATGFGGLALAGLMGTPAFGRTAPTPKAAPGLPGRGALRGTHFPPKAKSGIDYGVVMSAEIAMARACEPAVAALCFVSSPWQGAPSTF